MYKVIDPDREKLFGPFESIDEARGFVKGILEGDTTYYGKYYAACDFLIEEMKLGRDLVRKSLVKTIRL